MELYFFNTMKQDNFSFLFEKAILTIEIMNTLRASKYIQDVSFSSTPVTN